jgi:hypothetical protein
MGHDEHYRHRAGTPERWFEMAEVLRRRAVFSAAALQCGEFRA